jgi:phospholipase C
MDSRREFLKKAALLSGSAALANMLPPVIQKALAINPAVGSTFYDAEHIVFLMQENRSFDHILGTLQGVRGYNDPRAIQLPDKNKVWLQSNKEGDTYAPFHLNVKDTKVAWMGSLPHTWPDQTDARNDGKYDKWLDVKKARKAYADMPLTLGYCDRNDFPFYYSLADAFTVCDQHFCSSITGTHSNRHYWMTGTVREKNEVMAKAHLWNITQYDKPELNWSTFPEKLEKNGVSWKVYQNELTLGFGLNGEESDWLSNFGTNVLEYFQQFNTRLHPGGIANLEAKRDYLQQQIDNLEKTAGGEESAAKKLAAVKRLLTTLEADGKTYTAEAFAQLSEKEKALNGKAFSINSEDPFYHDLTPLSYDDRGTTRTLNIPKGDIFHAFRKDVENGSLPAVSWLMSPGNFSDHPNEPWFGPWYVSEVMEILLKNPEVWKKTIFILTYDENDGYFDHVPPFVVPDPYRENRGKVSAGIDPAMDFATRDQQINPSGSSDRIRESTIGLGYRVPMIIASPWTRGGKVCSEVFDHTSSLQFLEHFLAKKFDKHIEEENITAWRRTICGDLSSAFQPYNGEKMALPAFVEKTSFIETIHQTKFKGIPTNFKKLSAEEIAQINHEPQLSPWFPRQEKGIRPACALPYELYVDGRYDEAKKAFGIAFKAGNTVFGQRSAGSPFCVYAISPFQQEVMRTWNYAVKPGDMLEDQWDLADFQDKLYHLRVYGPNGFFREFRGDEHNPPVTIGCWYGRATADPSRLNGMLMLSIVNHDKRPHTLTIADLSYGKKAMEKIMNANTKLDLAFDTSLHHHWYDLGIKIKGFDTREDRFAGRIETGRASMTDPLMGGMV